MLGIYIIANNRTGVALNYNLALYFSILLLPEFQEKLWAGYVPRVIILKSGKKKI
jgi:hypothetical protein